MQDIREFTLVQLQQQFAMHGEKPFRAKQVYEWLWAKGVTRFDDMTNLSVTLRQMLNTTYALHSITEDNRQVSVDGTIKVRFRLHDTHLIESVLIPVPEDNRFTVCVSTQVGCSLTCSFCATGRMGRKRNLTPGEIYDQVHLINLICLETYHRPLTNVVYMGMGEPLLNYANTMRSIALLTAPTPLGRGMSSRRITISTAGIAKMIRQLADDGCKSNLALSLHAADDAKRNTIMPINETNHLEALMLALEYFYMKTKSRISYEYIAFDRMNDSAEDARLLLKLCKRKFPVRVNIIEYNPVQGIDFIKSGEDRLNAFANFLAKNGVTVTVRRSRGKDIDAACGQLANRETKE